jgi:hypothetical protein
VIALRELNPKGHPLDKEQEENLQALYDKLLRLQAESGIFLEITRGFSTPKEQLLINPKAPKSKHCLGAAADILDPQERLYRFCLSHMELVKSLGLYLENPAFDPDGHLHVQSLPPPSGHHIFIP